MRQSEQSISAVGRCCSSCSAADAYITLQPSFLLRVMHIPTSHVPLFYACVEQTTEKRISQQLRLDIAKNKQMYFPSALLVVQTTPRVWEPGTPGLLVLAAELERENKVEYMTAGVNICPNSFFILGRLFPQAG